MIFLHLHLKLLTRLLKVPDLKINVEYDTQLTHYGSFTFYLAENYIEGQDN